MIKFLIVRHGESLGNLNNIYLGHTDWDLSERGYHQAEMTAEFLKNEKIDVIYSSDLIRAYNTVLPMARQRGMEIIKDRNLREIYAGLWEGKKYDELSSVYEKEYDVWKKNIGNARCTGGESVMELQDRIINELTKIAEENEGKTVLIGTHATPIRALAAAANNVSKDFMYEIPWAVNASVTTAEYLNGKFVIKEYGRADFMGECMTKLSSNV